MSKPRLDIVDHRAFVCEKTVQLFEGLLAEAKEGKIHGAMVFAETDDGMSMHCFTDSDNYEKRLAQIEMLKFQWMCDCAGLIDQG